jgi:Mg-chelatase subunit ChlD
MKATAAAIVLFTATAAAVAVYPGLRGDVSTPAATTENGSQVLTAGRPRVEVVFVLDTTGSMGGLIAAAKEKIWSIAGTMSQAQPAPEIRIGLVAYRDRGDEYVTRVIDLSRDLDSMYATLMDFQAQGGGDGPESVNQALYDAVHRVSWSQDPDTYRVLFLVGDAPPHMDYQDDIAWPVTVEAAREKGIRVNTIQCGESVAARDTWNDIAAAGRGSFFQVEQAGGAVAIATPYDERLADLSEELDETRLYYGDAEDKERQERKKEATTKLHSTASVAARARRAVFNASESGEANLLDDKDLVEDVISGRVDLGEVAPEALPAPLQDIPREERQAVVEETAKRREALKRDIQTLSKERSDYLRAQVEAEGGAEASLDHGIFRSVRKQAKESGLNYEAEAPSY